MSDGISRRTFVERAAKTAAALSIGPMIVPRRVLGGVGQQAPSRTLNVAVVGAGGMGMENMKNFVAAGENLVAVCDVDYGYVERSLAGRLRPPPDQPPEGATPERMRSMRENYVLMQRVRDAYVKAAKYTDFREMLAKQKDIDAVVIATPDHLHAVIAAAAMRAGKHVYVQKPLTYSVQEARALARIAGETGVVTQMGNQGHSMEGTRRIVELIGAGVIGPVREVHVWTDRPLRYWAQGIPGPMQVAAWQQRRLQQMGPQQAAGNGGAGAYQPAQTNGQPLYPAAPRWGMGTVDAAVLREMAEEPWAPPPGMDWNLFLGPVAKPVPYHPAYHPFSWRGFVPFGVSSIGDMGAHLMDQPYWALGLTYPTSVVATSTPWGGPQDDPATYPLAMHARYEYAARGRMPAVTMHWYDGNLRPTLGFDVVYPGGDGGGGIFVGDRGYLTYETYGNNPTVYPEARRADAAKVKQSVARVTGTHEQNFAQAAKGETQPSCPFSYAAPLTENMLLGIVALRAGQGRRIEYDGANMRVTNVPEANQWLSREYRAGWSL